MSINTPYLATDGIIQVFDKNENFKGIVLIERKNPPLGLAIPGGFVEIGEKIEDALIREMKEETSLDVEIVRTLGVYSDPKRDPRFHAVSVVFVCKAYGKPKAQSDAKEAKIYKLEEIPFDKLVLDHKEILNDYLLR
ncbi:MAG: NUDIX hydrolase [Victivallaceae bacterium]|nr:NUDIX hydrolase [Victivallaceae bacterium]